jgi:TorA maturation chaperone TorD
MMNATTDSTVLDLARECLYRFLSAVLGDPYADRWGDVADAGSQRIARAAAELLRGEVPDQAFALAPGESPPDRLALEPLLDALERPISELRAEHDRVFGLVMPKECPPYETEYHPASEVFFRSQQLADIAGFYRAFGIQTSLARPERPDHIALELEFMAFLLMKKRMALETLQDKALGAEHAGICERAIADFFGDHLAWWVPAFAAGLGRKAGEGLYAAIAPVLSALIPLERQRLGLPAPARPVHPDLIERPEEQAGCAACPQGLAISA